MPDKRWIFQMKRSRLLATALTSFILCAVFAISCQPVEKAADNLQDGGYKFDFTIAAGGFGDTKADATIGWTAGEKVFVFFKPVGGGLLGDSYAEFTYSEGGWSPNSYIAPGALGAAGTMAAVYVPYLGDKTPVYTDTGWTIDGGDVYYSCASGASYTVLDGTVRGNLSMKIPDGYVQFAIDPAAAEEGDILECNYVDAYTCVSLSTELVFSETPVPDKKMTGHADNGKLYFWGKMNDATATECEWVLTNRSGDVKMKTSADKIAKNHAYNLASMPVHAMVQLWENGPYWATTNIGAEKPEDYGDYYAWGETETYYESGYAMEDPQMHWKVGKEIGHDWTTYKWSNETKKELTKYNHDIACGTVDGKTSMELNDDVAHVLWGDKWRMPTNSEFDEMIENCTWTWTTQGGINGYIVTGNQTGYTDKSIFLPAAGYRHGVNLDRVGVYGYFWSSSINMKTKPYLAYDLLFNVDEVRTGDVGGNRCNGRSVRPVYGDFIPVTSVTLDKTTASIVADETVTLTATVNPSNASEKTVVWTSSDETVATVENGVVTAVGVGTATITAIAGGKSATCTVTIKPEMVDLGLSVKWATVNVGASKPEGYGDYYAWGETEPHYEPGYAQSESPVWRTGFSAGYNWVDYQWCSGTNTSMTKYCTQASYGTVDNKTVLEMSDDVANVKWGGSWRMPTLAEWQELKDNCTWTWTIVNEVKGYKVTSNKSGYTDKSIFLPAAGRRVSHSLNDFGSDGDYWFSSLDKDHSYDARYLYFDSDLVRTDYGYRCHGRSVRPVYGDFIPVTSVTLDKTTASIVAGETVTLTATVNPSNASEKTVVWTSSDETVATVENGVVTAVGVGTATITAIAGGKSATCSVTVEEEIAGAVNLGLSVKWATCNVGASSPEEYGYLYQWAGTKDVTNTAISESAPYHTGSYLSKGWKKYIPADMGSYWWTTGSPDNKTVLEMADDVANVRLGGNWRMPTDTEWQELLDNCTWTWTTQSGVNGYMVTSNVSGYTSKSIFLPAAGWRNYTLQNVGEVGEYWSSSLSTNVPQNAKRMYFYKSDVRVDSNYRYCGQSVRPVTE